MNKNCLALLLIMGLAPFLVQCASQGAMHDTNVKVYSIDSQVKDIDQQVDQLRNQTVKQVQSRQAVVDNRLDVLEADLLQIKGKLEESGHNNRLLREENKEVESRLVARIEALDDALDKRLANLTETINQMNGQLAATGTQLSQAEAGIEKINKERAEEAAERARKAAEEARKAAEAAQAAKSSIVRPNGSVHISAEKHKKVVAETPASADRPEVGDGAGSDLYAQALTLFKENKIDEAYKGFSGYIDKYPDGKMAANARFWMGDCLYNQNEFELAILDYQKVIADYPHNPKAPAALLKQGMAFEKLNDKTTAIIVYQKILDNYPESDQAATAKSRLQALQ
jgi:tol-pal system protein YbgF